MNMSCWIIDETINLTETFLATTDYLTPGFGVVDARTVAKLIEQGLTEVDAKAFAAFVFSDDGRLHGVADDQLSQEQYDRLSLGNMIDPRPQMKRTYARTSW